jgi:proteasome lid subunit RPN8/RPN11
MVKRAKDGGDYEVGGFLLGGLHHYDGRRYVDITTQVPALKAESARAHLTFSNEAQKAFHETMEKDHPDALVLGWYHTHPGYGVFLSGYDQFIQRSFYAGDHHVAIVIDPHSDEVGVFVWEQGEISRPYALVVYGKE